MDRDLASGGPKTPRVVAIAGAPGSGKSSLVRCLADLCRDSATLHFDDYQTLTREPPERILSLLEGGGGLRGFGLEDLARELVRLRSGPSAYVFFEMPLGRTHPPTAAPIDLLVWIDTPPDVALARTLRAFLDKILAGETSEGPRQPLVWLAGYLDNYLRFVRRLLDYQVRTVRGDADIVVDGTADIAALARSTLRAIEDQSR